MQITEQLIERIARRVFNTMFTPALRQSNVVTGSGSGGSVQYAAEAGHAISADSATNATNATKASSVPWSGVSLKPDVVTKGSDGVVEVGQYLDFHKNNTTSDYSVRLVAAADSQVSINLPSSAGTLALTSQIPSVPSNVSVFNNDAGYITSSALTGYATQTWVGNNYLPLSGGTITGNLTVNQTFTCQNVEIGHTNEVNATGSDTLYLQYRNSGNLCLCYNGHNVGIGTNSPSYKLHVAGSIYATGAITERSDIRCKDVETYQWAPSLSMIAEAPIIRYSMKDDEAHRMRVGTVAQYWEKVMPEAVSKASDGILSIAQGDICMVCVIAMAREIERLKAKIND